ncbi:hypothetical protein BAE44_0009596, partial [Dichanthelium oligosanthes]
CIGRSSQLFKAESTKATAAAAANSTSTDESKLKLIFCVKNLCSTGKGGVDVCYCCQRSPEDMCFNSSAECQAYCPVCNPKCQSLLQSSADSVREKHSSNVLDTNSTLF